MTPPGSAGVSPAPYSCKQDTSRRHPLQPCAGLAVAGCFSPRWKRRIDARLAGPKAERRGLAAPGPGRAGRPRSRVGCSLRSLRGAAGRPCHFRRPNPCHFGRPLTPETTLLLWGTIKRGCPERQPGDRVEPRSGASTSPRDRHPFAEVEPAAMRTSKPISEGACSESGALVLSCPLRPV